MLGRVVATGERDRPGLQLTGLRGAICFRNRVPSEHNGTSCSAEEPLTATTAVIATGTL